MKIADFRHLCFSSRFFIISLISVVSPWIWFLAQGNIGLSLWDEGFLWYGAQRVIDGDVPLRDFQAYDVGRYYWAAGFLALLGSKGIIALRISHAAMFSLTMLIIANLAVLKSRWLTMLDMLLVAITFMLWMVPDYKVANFFASALLLFALAFVIDTPTVKRYFVCGVIVGFVAILGRNHGMYGIFGSVGAFSYIALTHKVPKTLSVLSAWISGVFIGYLPMLLLLIMVPGFLDAMVDSVRMLFEYKATNLAKAIPKPWWANFNNPYWIETISQVLTGLFFIAIIPIFSFLCLYLLSSKFLLLSKIAFKHSMSPVFISAVLLMLPYGHYAYSRADNVHLSLGILPFLMAAITFPFTNSGKYSQIIIRSLFILSVLVMLPLQPLYGAVKYINTMKSISINGDVLNVDSKTAESIVTLNELCSKYAQNGRHFYATPFWPGAYAVMQRRSPTWEIYSLFPRSEAFQKTEIFRIQNADVGLVIITDYLLDGRKDLLFQATHQLTEQYVKESFLPVDNLFPGQNIHVFISPSN